MISILVSKPGQFEGGCLIGNPGATARIAESELDSSWTDALTITTDRRQRRLLIVRARVEIEVGISVKGDPFANETPVLIDPADGSVCSYVAILPSGTATIKLRAAQ